MQQLTPKEKLRAFTTNVKNWTWSVHPTISEDFDEDTAKLLAKIISEALKKEDGKN